MPASVPSFGVITINNAVPIGCTSPLAVAGYVNVRQQRSAADKQANLQPFMRMNQQLFAEEGIALVIVDCPTDQWGVSGPRLTSCLDGYRSSKEHADDVRSVIARLRDEHGFSRFS